MPIYSLKCRHVSTEQYPQGKVSCWDHTAFNSIIVSEYDWGIPNSCLDLQVKDLWRYLVDFGCWGLKSNFEKMCANIRWNILHEQKDPCLWMKDRFVYIHLSLKCPRSFFCIFLSVSQTFQFCNGKMHSTGKKTLYVEVHQLFSFCLQPSTLRVCCTVGPLSFRFTLQVYGSIHVDLDVDSWFCGFRGVCLYILRYII